MTLLEMTVVILVMMSLIVLLFVGGEAWKRGSDRALCIMNMELVQKGVRGYSNLYNHQPGEVVAGLHSRVIGTGNLVESEPECPAGGTYTSLEDQIPDLGVVYLECSLEASFKHVPDDFTGW
jgi:hypothetical protein